MDLKPIIEQVKNDPNFPAAEILEALEFCDRHEIRSKDYFILWHLAVKHPAINGDLFIKLVRYYDSSDILENPAVNFIFLEDDFLNKCLKDKYAVMFFIKHGNIAHIKMFMTYLIEMHTAYTVYYNPCESKNVLHYLLANKHFKNTSEQEQLEILNQIFIYDLNDKDKEGKNLYPYKKSIKYFVKYFNTTSSEVYDGFNKNVLISMANHLHTIKLQRLEQLFQQKEIQK